MQHGGGDLRMGDENVYGDLATPRASSGGAGERNPFDLLGERDASAPTRPAFTPGAAFRSGVPTTSVTRVEPDFTMKLPPLRARTRQESTPVGVPKGLLTVVIKEARRLSLSPMSRPVIVVQFDQNEYIGVESRECTGSSAVWDCKVVFDVTADSIVYVNVYDRVDGAEELLGTCELHPRMVHRGASEQLYPLTRSNDGEAPVPVGEIRVHMMYERLPPRKLTAADFEFLKLIGRGTFGRVFQVRKRDTKRIYAMKVLYKREIALKKEVGHTMGERKILEKSHDCPFLVSLKFSFQSEKELFFVTDYKSGGELFWHLQREGRFTEARARFYVAEIVLALEHLHKYDIVYRDLKPENILLDATGHVALCDFGLSKPDLGQGQLTTTFCGTTEYLAPEILLDESGYSKLVDFWSLGVLLFEMCCGWSPFYAEDTQQMYRNICFGKIKFPRGAISDDGKQFVKGLLNRNPKHRLGAQRDAQDLREHPFFKEIDFEALARKQIPPLFKPLVESDESVANFDPEFTSAGSTELKRFNDEAHMHAPAGRVEVSPERSVPIATNQASAGASPEDEPLSSSVQEKFRGFSYTGSYDSTAGSGMESRLHAAGLGRDDDDDYYGNNDDYDDDEDVANMLSRTNLDGELSLEP
ncbi:non-specific serine/threonine protein kinase [Malassezia cuniculi]|uniref:Non-specific serine/threonine protein kinase n=1 Tax=Malassezia cuniculi TaxID=948313 RepID=A0AAF0EQT9_9BASI|nr:non-specific serine/threonine protein kinase [Malassezia cuniculi]